MPASARPCISLLPTGSERCRSSLISTSTLPIETSFERAARITNTRTSTIAVNARGRMPAATRLTSGSAWNTFDQEEREVRAVRQTGHSEAVAVRSAPH